MLFVAPLTSWFCTRINTGERQVNLYGLRKMNGRDADPRLFAKFTGSPRRLLEAESYICKRKPAASELVPMSSVNQKSVDVTMRSSELSRAVSAKLTTYHAGTLYRRNDREATPGT